MATNSVLNIVYKSTITHTATVGIFDVMSDKFNLDRICT